MSSHNKKVPQHRFSPMASLASLATRVAGAMLSEATATWQPDWVKAVRT